MELEKSSLYREVQAILSSENKPVYFNWSAIVHAGNKNYGIIKLLSIDILRDYESSYADQTIVTLAISTGTFAKHIYPNQGTLDITLTRLPMFSTGMAMDKESEPETERYTAVLLDEGNPMIESNAPYAVDETAMNLTSISEVKFQLIDKAVEQLRMISVGGIYRKTKVEDVIKGVLTKESQSVKVDGVKMPQGVDMVVPSNIKERDHILIPQGTKLTDVPKHIQVNCGGVYASGLGHYIQDDHWYVYPLYDTGRIHEVKETLTLINIPPNKLPGIEKSYRRSGTNTVALATGKSLFRDNSDSAQLNKGNGVRFADASKFMDDFSVTTGNKTYLSRGTNNSEFLNAPRENGFNNVQLSDVKINANPYLEYSKLSQRNGSTMGLVWENSLPSLIYPGMLVKIMYQQEDEIMNLTGVVIKAHHYIHLKEKGFASNRHTTNTALTIFVNRVSE